jgi:hypothetical protein
MYKLGAGIDRPKPARLPAIEVTRRYRERQKLKEKFDPFFAICRPNVAVSREADTL